MTKRLLGAALATGLAIASFGSPAMAGGTDAATGGGWFDNGSFEFKFNFHAKTLQNGDARGEFRWWNPEVGFVAEVTVSCLEVSGATALLGGVVTSSTSTGLVGSNATVKVIDGGEGANAGQDFFSFVLISLPPCTEPRLPVPLIKGNIQVQDR